MTQASNTSVFTLHEVALRCGVDTEFVEQLVGIGVIEFHPEVQSGFAREVTLRVTKLLRLQRDLGVNLEGAAVIVELLDRIEALEQELRSLRAR